MSASTWIYKMKGIDVLRVRQDSWMRRKQKIDVEIHSARATAAWKNFVTHVISATKLNILKYN